MEYSFLFFHILFFLTNIFVYLRGKNASAFNPLTLYFLFHAFVFVVRPFLVIVFDFDHAWWYMGFEPNSLQKIEALLVSDLGMFCFAMPFYFLSKARTDIVGFSEKYFVSPSAFEINALISVLVLFAPLGIYSALVATVNANPEDIGMEIVNGIRINTETSGYITDSRNLLYGIALLVPVVLRFKWYSFFPFAIFIAHRFYIGYSRWGVILSVIAIGLLYLFKFKRRWPEFKVVVIVIPLFLLFNIVGQNREFFRSFFEGVESSSTVFDLQGFNKYDTLDFANFDYLCYVVSVVPDKTENYSYGTQYLQLLTEPIPRILWKEKPYGPPIQFFDLNDYGNFLGLTVSLPGDGWMSGGVIGVVLTMSFWGWVFARLHRSFISSQDDYLWVLFYVSLIPFSIQLFRDGGISIFRFVLFSLAPIVLYIFLVKRNDQKIRKKYH